MKITDEMLNIDEFDRRTNNKWKNEPIQFHKCKECKFIVLVLPDCHVAFSNHENWSKKTLFNLPRKIRCPHCNIIWHQPPKISTYQVEDVSVDELKTSQWNWILNVDD